jgi:hypothetical protein
VVHAAAGASAGTFFEPAEQEVGDETVGVDTEVPSNGGVAVPRRTIDSIAAEHNVSDVDVLSIDTEGSDALVLLGASSMLRQRRVRVLEFEYTSRGNWLSSSLNDTLVWLAHAGYRCFWQGNHGVLAPAQQTTCNVEFRVWSNLVCAHETAVLRELQALAVRDA